MTEVGQFLFYGSLIWLLHLVITEILTPTPRHCEEYIFLVECVSVVYGGTPPRHCEELSDVAIHLKFKLAKTLPYKNKKAT